MVAIIDYGAGNLFSVHKAFLHLGAKSVITRDADTIKSASHLVLPGVGSFGDCMNNLQKSGVIPAIKSFITDGKPFLGICVGLQLLFEHSEESPNVEGLGLCKGTVKKINAHDLKVPHMGWNSIHINELSGVSSLFCGLTMPYMYFVHSYHVVPDNEKIITSKTTYGEKLVASIRQSNIQAVQFHPEKSGDVGLKLLENFLQC